jgi:hypothetical protein
MSIFEVANFDEVNFLGCLKPESDAAEMLAA